MSTERGRGERRRVLRFRRLLATTMATLTLLVVGLTIANASQGPRLAAAEVNAQAAIARADQSLVLRTHQRIQPVAAADVRVEPATPVSISSDESTVTIRFEEMLAYAADYTVTVDATTASTGVRSSLRYTFSTPDATLFALVRPGAGQDDRIFRREIGRGTMTEVFATPAIQSFAVVGDRLAVVTLEPDLTSRLQLRPVDGGPSAEILLPSAGTVTQLAASDASNLLGFLFTPRGAGASGPATSLIVYDAASDTGVGREVLGPDGKPLRVVDWTFVPSTTSVVAQTADLNLYLIDVLANDPPLPLGQHQEIRNFMPGTRTLTVADVNGPTAIDLTTGDATALTLPPDGSTEADSAGDVVILGEDRYLEVLMTPEYGPTATRLNPRIISVDTGGPEILYEPSAEDTDIGGMCISPNGRQLAVQLLPADRAPDASATLPESTDMSIVILDAGTGASLGGMNGVLASWC